MSTLARDAGPHAVGSRRLLAVRHAQTAWNAAGRYQGHADVDLDDEGRAQADVLANAFRGFAADRLVTSDLRRAVQTAGPLALTLRREPLTDPRLREVEVGAWEGLTA
ncbi:MAG: histidine phosphatase family protein, partial [Acidimicrobiales bacterium]